LIRRDWRFVNGLHYYYYQVHNGKVIGQAYNLANSIIWGAKIPISATEELILGQYIEMEYAKKAIEEYWNEKDRTLEVPSEHLLSTL
jgi:hypothetical protein